MYRDEEQRDFARRLRNESTEAEKSLWYFLRGNKLGVKFRRQAAICSYVVDFVCFSHRLIVELDGPQHVTEEGKAHDERRTTWLMSRGYRVIRFRNQQLDDEIHQVVAEIERVLGELVAREDKPPSLTLPARGRGPIGFLVGHAVS